MAEKLIIAEMTSASAKKAIRHAGKNIYNSNILRLPLPSGHLALFQFLHGAIKSS